jgi:hypothetical protein
MSISVKCTIVVSEQQYEAGTENQEIFTILRHASSTGKFSGTPGVFVRSLIESASNMAAGEALERLKAIKGDIQFNDEKEQPK